MNQAALKYQNIFDEFASSYHLVDALFAGIPNRLRKRAIKNSNVSNKGLVIDLMCGSGNNVKYLEQNISGKLKYLGLDFSNRMVMCATDKFSMLSNVAFMETNIFCLSKESEKADYILCSYGLKCIDKEDYHRFVDLIDNIINTTGTLSIVEFQLPKSLFLKIIFKFYLSTVYRLACLFTVGNMMPAKALLQTLSNTMDLELLKSKFDEKDIEITIEKRWNNGAVFITGRRKQ